MHAIRTIPFSLLALAAVVVAGCAAVGVRDKTYHPHVDPANFTAGVVDNPYFPLVPGTVFTFIEKSKNETSENIVTVTRDTKEIMGVKCVVVHDVVKKHGRVAVGHRTMPSMVSAGRYLRSRRNSHAAEVSRSPTPPTEDTPAFLA